MPDLSLFISKTGFCFFIIPILCSRARQFVRSKLHIFDKIRHRIRNHKKPAEFAVENRRKIFTYSLRCMPYLRPWARSSQSQVLFSSVRKARIFSFGKGETCPFLVRTRKERKEAANVPFDHLCGRQRFDGGYKRRHPRSRCSRDPSIAVFR